MIEVWYRQRGRDVAALPGLQLLLDNGYKLFDVDLNQIGASSADINKMLSTYCAKAGTPEFRVEEQMNIIGGGNCQFYGV